MKIREILKRKGTEVITIEVQKNVLEAIGKLNKHGIGALVVTGFPADEEELDPNISHEHLRFSWGGTHSTAVESREICGVITERDIMQHCGERCSQLGESQRHGEDGCPALVADLMTKEVIIGLPDDDINYAMSVMVKKGVGHLPILEDGELVGIVSMNDVIQAHVEEADYEVRMLKDYVQGRTY